MSRTRNFYYALRYIILFVGWEGEKKRFPNIRVSGAKMLMEFAEIEIRSRKYSFVPAARIYK